jgi:hypothetical protein
VLALSAQHNTTAQSSFVLATLLLPCARLGLAQESCWSHRVRVRPGVGHCVDHCRCGIFQGSRHTCWCPQEDQGSAAVVAAPEQSNEEHRIVTILISMSLVYLKTTSRICKCNRAQCAFCLPFCSPFLLSFDAHKVATAVCLFWSV